MHITPNYFLQAEEAKRTLHDRKPLNRAMLTTEYWTKKIIATSSQRSAHVPADSGNGKRWTAEDAMSKSDLPMVAVGVFLKRIGWCGFAVMLILMSTVKGIDTKSYYGY